MRYSRRAQIRGIDFSMALIIFMLVMSQILIMTSDLIQTNYDKARTFQQGTRISDYSESVVSSEGFPTSWGTTLTAALPATWKFGLKTPGSNSLDPTKIGRLSDTTNSSYRLSYSDVKQGLNSSIGDKTFEIKLGYTFQVNITSTTPTGSNIDVAGVVSKNGQGLNYSTVWVFGVNLAGVVSTSTISATDGTFSATLMYAPLPSYSRIVVIARYGAVTESMDTTTFVNTVTPTVANVTLQERNTLSSGSMLDMHVAGSSADYDYHALFIPPVTSTTASTSDLITGGTSSSLNIPEKGIIVIVVVSQTLDEVGVTAFPTSVDMQPTNVPSDTSNSYTTTVLCRGILITFEFTVWENAA